MKGATAEPEVNTIRLPSKRRHTTMGKSQNFFRSFMNPQSSATNSIMLVAPSEDSSQTLFNTVWSYARQVEIPFSLGMFPRRVQSVAALDPLPAIA
jgi:hypothetical protein